jgi:hypothetical protein
MLMVPGRGGLSENGCLQEKCWVRRQHEGAVFNLAGYRAARGGMGKIALLGHRASPAATAFVSRLLYPRGAPASVQWVVGSMRNSPLRSAIDESVHSAVRIARRSVREFFE